MSSLDQTTRSVPESTLSVPESTPSVPESTPSVPASTPSVPESTPSVPESTLSVPESTLRAGLPPREFDEADGDSPQGSPAQGARGDGRVQRETRQHDGSARVHSSEFQGRQAWREGGAPHAHKALHKPCSH
eukprot:8540-Prorocentrum_minimum.AAC.1